MASYLSYFTSGTSANQSAPYGQQNAPNTSASSTWSSAFSSRISTLRKALTKDSEEDDPDHEDCSHVSNVLRAYYVEKGRTFPEWLPPDPKKPAPAPPPPPQNMYSQYGGGYGSQYGSQPDFGRQASAQSGGLSDLWDASPPQPQPQSQSLRAPRPTPQSLRSQDSYNSQPSGLHPTYAQQAPSARPLPSQRAGSYQNTAANPPAPAGLGSRDRLRAKLQGGGSGRSSPAPQGQQQPSYSGPANSYDSGGSGGSPYVSASEPWSSAGGNPYLDQPAGNPYADSGSARPRPGGLPSGPRGPR